MSAKHRHQWTETEQADYGGTVVAADRCVACKALRAVVPGTTTAKVFRRHGMQMWLSYSGHASDCRPMA